MKISCSSFFVCSNRHSDMKPLNVNHVADYNLGFLLLFISLFIGFFGVISILENVDASQFCAISTDSGTFQSLKIFEM